MIDARARELTRGNFLAATMVQTHAFISYVRDNSAIVDRLAKDLRAFGVKIWLDRDDIRPGQRWKDAISEAIHQGGFFIACFSQEFGLRNESFMHTELRVAIDRLRNMPNNRIWFIPVLLNATEIPLYSISDSEPLSNIQAISLQPDWNHGLVKILRAMKLDDPTHRRALHLIDLLNHHPPELNYAIAQLAEINHVPADAVPALIKALKGDDANVRGQAIRVLGNIGEAAAEAVPAVAAAIQDQNEAVQEAAVEALNKIGPIGQLALVKTFGAVEFARSALGELGNGLKKLGPKAISVGIKELHSDITFGRYVGAAMLWSIGPDAAEAAPALAVSLKDDPDESVRQMAAAALGEIRSSSADGVPALFCALSDSDTKTRRQAAEALTKIGPAASDALPALAAALRNDPDQKVRAIVALAFGAIAPDAAEAVPALIAALKDVDEDVRRHVALSLGAIGAVAAESTPALIAALHDPDAAVRRNAADSLGEIGPVVEEVKSALIAALKDNDNEARKNATRSLGRMVPVPAEVIHALIGLFEDPVGDAVLVAQKVLEKIGPPAIPALTETFTSSDMNTRWFAASTLAGMGQAAAKAVPALANALGGDSYSYVRSMYAAALACIGPVAVEATQALSAALKDDDDQIQDQAARALGNIGPAAAEAVPILSTILEDDPPEHVRKRVIEALEKIASPDIPTASTQ